MGVEAWAEVCPGGSDGGVMGSRRWMRVVAGCCAAWTGCLGPVPAVGQTHKVAKPEAVVRAVGVYEWTGDLAKPKGERLVPVTLFIDGHVEDAAVYLARPVPMALNQGTIYELDEAGVEKGLVDVKEARHVQVPAAANLEPFDDGWFGYGSFQAPPVPKPAAVKKPTQNVAVNGKAAAVDKDPDRPSFSNRGTRSSTSSNDSDDKPASGSPEDVKVDSGTGDKDDVDRPTLRRRPPADPKDAKKARKEAGQSSVTGTAKSLNDDPDRPTIKRGKGPAEDELPVLNGLPADMKQMVAISDAKRRDAHPFARAWEDEAEHQAVLGKMRAAAQAQLVAYGPVPAGTAVTVAADGKAGPPPAAKDDKSQGVTAQDTSTGAPPVLRRNKVAVNAAAQEQVTAPVASVAPAAAPASAAATAHAKARAVPQTAAAKARAARAAKKAAAAAPAAGTVLTGEEVKGFTLSYGGAATYVYTAQTVGEGAARRYVTVVAQDDGVNGLKIVMKNVTDAAHLDRTAWMRFVDVVDVEASNRASLLFEMRGQSSRQFALYRVLGARADTVFTGGTTQ